VRPITGVSWIRLFASGITSGSGTGRGFIDGFRTSAIVLIPAFEPTLGTARP
jgi:hypothetical protein